MNVKSQKGFTGVDIAIAIAVLFIFVTLISILFYNFNSTSNEIEVEAKALEIAIQEIEKIKSKNIENVLQELTTEKIAYGKNANEAEAQEIQKGFYRKVIVEDYSDNHPGATTGLVKKITVQIQYKLKKEIKTLELSTILSKESE